jgi:hypothetical protein
MRQVFRGSPQRTANKNAMAGILANAFLRKSLYNCEEGCFDGRVDLTINQSELFPGLTAAAPKRSRFRQFMDAFEKHGPLLTQAMAANVMEVSRTRVSQLVQNGKLGSVDVAGVAMVPVAAVELWLSEDVDPGGRPKNVSLGGMMKHAFNERREAKQRVAAAAKKS